MAFVLFLNISCAVSNIAIAAAGGAPATSVTFFAVSAVIAIGTILVAQAFAGITLPFIAVGTVFVTDDIVAQTVTAAALPRIAGRAVHTSKQTVRTGTHTHITVSAELVTAAGAAQYMPLWDPGITARALGLLIHGVLLRRGLRRILALTNRLRRILTAAGSAFSVVAFLTGQTRSTAVPALRLSFTGCAQARSTAPITGIKAFLTYVAYASVTAAIIAPVISIAISTQTFFTFNAVRKPISSAKMAFSCITSRTIAVGNQLAFSLTGSTISASFTIVASHRARTIAVVALQGAFTEGAITIAVTF